MRKIITPLLVLVSLFFILPLTVYAVAQAPQKTETKSHLQKAPQQNQANFQKSGTPPAKQSSTTPSYSYQMCAQDKPRNENGSIEMSIVSTQRVLADVGGVHPLAYEIPQGYYTYSSVEFRSPNWNLDGKMVVYFQYTYALSENQETCPLKADMYYDGDNGLITTLSSDGQPNATYAGECRYTFTFKFEDSKVITKMGQNAPGTKAIFCAENSQPRAQKIEFLLKDSSDTGQYAQSIDELFIRTYIIKTPVNK